MLTSVPGSRTLEKRLTMPTKKKTSRKTTSIPTSQTITTREMAAWVLEHLGEAETSEGETLREAFTQADIELALDDRGWLVGGKRMAGELDPMSRVTQVNKNRYYWLKDPLAKQAIRLWTDYSLGDMAMSWTCEEDENVQTSLDKFMKSRRNRLVCSRKGQRTITQRLLVDGEVFLAFFGVGADKVLVRSFDCLQITDVITNPQDEDDIWGYKRTITPRYDGTATPGVNKVLYYRDWTNQDAQLYDPATRKPVKAEEAIIYHWSHDTLSKRGNGLLSCCSDWAVAHRKFMTCRVAIAQALSKFAFKMSMKGGQKMVNAVRAKTESTYSQTGLNGGTEHQPPTAPGGTWIQNEGVDLTQMKVDSGAAGAKVDSDNLKLQVASGTGLGLHYFGDNSTGNLATSTAMELPMLKMFMSFQVSIKDSWREIFAIVLDEGEDDEPANIVIELPPILDDDLQKLGAFLTGLAGMFPEAKVPSLLRMCLMSANVNNIDDVMKEIEDKKKAMDANVAAGKNPDGSTPTPIAVAGLKAGAVPPKQEDQTEAVQYARLTAALEKLAEVMR